MAFKFHAVSRRRRAGISPASDATSEAIKTCANCSRLSRQGRDDMQGPTLPTPGPTLRCRWTCGAWA